VSPSEPAGPSLRKPVIAAAAPPVAVPAAAMLAPAEAGPGAWHVDDDIAGDWNVYVALQQCELSWTWPYIEHIGLRERALRRDHERGTPFVLQAVRQYAPGWAARVMADLRAQLNACATFDSMHGGKRFELRVLRTGFVAGMNESLVVESTGPAGKGRWGFIRRGERICEFVVEPYSDAEIVRVGRAIGARLARAGG
jgi:hypothetical protein